MQPPLVSQLVEILAWLLPAAVEPSPSLLVARAASAALVAAVATVALGYGLIGWLRTRCLEPIHGPNETLRRLQAQKPATPTLGGLFMAGGVAAALLVSGALLDASVACAAAVGAGMLVVGLVDDLVKLRAARQAAGARGLTPPQKLTAQLLVALPAALVLYQQHGQHAAALAPAVGWSAPINAASLYVPLAAIVIVGAANAVNLTDGLDGLAAGCLIPPAVVLAVAGLAPLVAASASAVVPGAESASAARLAIAAAALAGAAAGFLWFNSPPARVYMGDTGALPLGGMLAVLALAGRHEAALAAAAGVFLVETLSVVVQVAWRRSTGRRLLRCAPLHHHFQFAGWPEKQIVHRFWLAAAVCGAAGLAVAAWQAPSQAPPTTIAAPHVLVR